MALVPGTLFPTPPSLRPVPRHDSQRTLCQCHHFHIELKVTAPMEREKVLTKWFLEHWALEMCFLEFLTRFDGGQTLWIISSASWQALSLSSKPLPFLSVGCQELYSQFSSSSPPPPSSTRGQFTASTKWPLDKQARKGMDGQDTEKGVQTLTALGLGVEIHVMLLLSSWTHLPLINFFSPGWNEVCLRRESP